MVFMEKSFDALWVQMLQWIRKQISPQSFETWFAPTRQVSATESSISVEVPNKFFKDWLLEHYKDHLSLASKEACGADISIEFVVCEQHPETETPDAERKRGGFFARTFERFAPPADFVFNSKYTFDSFVIGGCNRFAHAASLAVAETPAKAYNPLFIYGGVGLGKTHLMQAIGQHAVRRNQRLRVLYISSEKFTNQLISAIQNRTTPAFREKYRAVDILLIDDIHFISGKESTQEEFFHTFNTLYDAHKQIVVSSDRAPKEIPALERRLISRFEWGLVTDIQAPDLETRIAILRKKIESEAVEIPDDVLFFIAERISSNIRELEGALIRVVAYASLLGQKIDVDVAKEVFKEAGEEDVVVVDVDKIKRVVAEFFGISKNYLGGKRRVKKVVFPRQVAMFLAREMTKRSLLEIGGFFGGRDHSTVIHSCDKVEEEMKKNPQARIMVDKLINLVKAGG